MHSKPPTELFFELNYSHLVVIALYDLPLQYSMTQSLRQKVAVLE